MKEVCESMKFNKSRKETGENCVKSCGSRFSVCVCHKFITMFGNVYVKEV